MKSISDILNSMVQPTEQHSLLGGNQGSSTQGANPSVGSFSDVLSRLNSQNASTANVTSNTGNNGATNTNTQNSGSTVDSDNQITVTEVQVSEKVQSNNLNQATLSNIENATASLAMALSKLVNLASQAQNSNQTQAQNLIISASGGTINASQAQQLVTQIADLKNQNNGQNALSLTPEQQNALLLQMMQSMIQNQQVTFTNSPDTQNNQNSLLSGSQNSSLLQFSFTGNQNGNTQIESLSIDVQTLNLQVSNLNQMPQSLLTNAPQSTNLTDATTQKLTQLLQQLNVTPSGTPTNIQVQSSSASINSPELAKNFQNLVQILTQSGAGQAVLSNYLTQNKNNVANNNFEQALNQFSQTQNALGIQSVSVTSISESASANSALISNDGQNNSAANQTRLLNDSLGGQYIQLTVQNPQIQNNNQVQTAAFTASVQIPKAPIQSTSGSELPLPVTNPQAPQLPAVTNETQNIPTQSETNQPLTALQTANAKGPTALSEANAALNQTVQPNIPVGNNVAQNVPSQSVTPTVNTQSAQAVDTVTAGQNNQSQSVANPNSEEALSQPQDVFSNGHLQALNGIVARFNSAVVSGQAIDPNVINYINNINQYPSETQAENRTLNQAATVQATSPALKLEPVTQTVNVAADVVLNNQNTQQASNLTGNNVQNQLVQPTSPTTQQTTNIINDSTQNLFVQTGANTTVTNLVNASVGTTALNTVNSSPTTVNPSTSVISSAPVVQQIVTANQSTVVVNPSSSSASGAPVTVASTSPVVTQPVTNPASMTAQNVPAATVAGETAKASVPVLVLSNTNNNNNAPAVSAVSSVSAASSVQPVTSQAVSQTSNASETSANLNSTGNFSKNTLSDSANLQNLAAAVNAGVTATTDKTGNAFQNTVNTVANSNPNGSVDSSQILNQITQQVASQTADAKMVNRLSFQLVPESLGRVTVQVALVDQAISARIMVSNPDVREVLQQHMVDLKAALSQAGLQIDQMQVQVQGGGANLLNQYFQYQQEGNSYRESAWTPSNTPEIVQNSDNSSLLVTAGSSSLNFLV